MQTLKAFLTSPSPDSNCSNEPCPADGDAFSVHPTPLGVRYCLGILTHLLPILCPQLLINILLHIITSLNQLKVHLPYLFHLLK